MKRQLRLLPLLFFGLVVVLFCQGCPPSLKYDIVGSWMADAIVEGQLRTAALTFTGNPESGSCTMTSEGELYSGTYSVSDEDVEFSFEFGGKTVITFEGSFEDKDTMSGSGVSDMGSAPDLFTWSAVRKK